MEDQSTKQEKKSKIALIQMILTAAILAIMIVIGITLVSGINTVQKNMTLIEKDLEDINMDDINTTIKSLDSAASSLGQLDMDSLNDLLKSLDKTAKNLETVTDALAGIGNLLGLGG